MPISASQKKSSEKQKGDERPMSIMKPNNKRKSDVLPWSSSGHSGDPIEDYSANSHYSSREETPEELEIGMEYDHIPVPASKRVRVMVAASSKTTGTAEKKQAGRGNQDLKNTRTTGKKVKVQPSEDEREFQESEEEQEDDSEIQRRQKYLDGLTEQARRNVSKRKSERTEQAITMFLDNVLEEIKEREEKGFEDENGKKMIGSVKMNKQIDQLVESLKQSKQVIEAQQVDLIGEINQIEETTEQIIQSMADYANKGLIPLSDELKEFAHSTSHRNKFCKTINKTVRKNALAALERHHHTAQGTSEISKLIKASKGWEQDCRNV